MYRVGKDGNPPIHLTDKALEDFYKWDSCINSGEYIRIEKRKNLIIQRGYCGKFRTYINLKECRDCNKYRRVRVPVSPGKTATQIERIKKGRQRAIKRAEEIEMLKRHQKTFEDYSLKKDVKDQGTD